MKETPPIDEIDYSEYIDRRIAEGFGYTLPQWRRGCADVENMLIQLGTWPKDTDEKRQPISLITQYIGMGFTIEWAPFRTDVTVKRGRRRPQTVSVVSIIEANDATERSGAITEVSRNIRSAAGLKRTA